MAKLTAEQIKTYLANDTKCPYCGSESLNGGERTLALGRASQAMQCDTCGRGWTDEYTLTGITEED